MTFNIRNLSVLSYANGFTLWFYRGDAIASVVEPGFFDPAADMLRKGDAILASAEDDGVLLHVAAAEGTVVVKPFSLLSAVS